MSPGAYSDLVVGIEERARGGGQHHVAALCPEGDYTPDMETVFYSRAALNEWEESLPADCHRNPRASGAFPADPVGYSRPLQL